MCGDVRPIPSVEHTVREHSGSIEYGVESFLWVAFIRGVDYELDRFDGRTYGAECRTSKSNHDGGEFEVQR